MSAHPRSFVVPVSEEVAQQDAQLNHYPRHEQNEKKECHHAHDVIPLGQLQIVVQLIDEVRKLKGIVLGHSPAGRGIDQQMCMVLARLALALVERNEQLEQGGALSGESERHASRWSTRESI